MTRFSTRYLFGLVFHVIGQHGVCAERVSSSPTGVVMLQTNQTQSKGKAEQPNPSGSVGVVVKPLRRDRNNAKDTRDAAPRSSQSSVTAQNAWSFSLSDRAWELFERVNALRAEGYVCPDDSVYPPNWVPLRFDCRLWRATRLHSEDMVWNDFLGHQSSDGTSPWTRAEEQGADAESEIIAAGDQSPASVLETWLTDTNCNRLMDPASYFTAIGYATGGTYGHYWTQMFEDDIAVDNTCFSDRVAIVSPQAWQNFKLLNELRADGYTCPYGNHYTPNDAPLRFDCRLWRAARLHSEDMANQGYFSHSSLDGRLPWDRAREHGTDAEAENIGSGRFSGSGTLQQWKESDGQCNTMMDPSFRVAAVGYAAGGPSDHYWTQMFNVDSSVDLSCLPMEETTTTMPAIDWGPLSEVSPGAWAQFLLLNKLRAQGYACPSGSYYRSNYVPLEFDCRLWRAAKLHSEDMAALGIFSSESPELSPWLRAEAQGIQAHAVNIGTGRSSPSSALQKWMKDDGPCDELMNADARVVGIGYSTSGLFGHYWTQVFSFHSPWNVDTSCYPQRSAKSSAQELDKEVADFIAEEPVDDEVRQIWSGKSWQRAGKEFVGETWTRNTK